MFTHNIDPALLHLGPFEIRYYGLFYVIGFIVAYFMIDYLAKQKKFKLGKNKIEDVLVYGGIAGIIGARLFYILVYDFLFYLQNPLEIFAIWHGGLSFHGALIGALIGVYLFAKKNKYNVLELLDIMVIPFAFALCLGRIGNFMNGELYGRITNVPWCVNFPSVDGCRHPSQIYEAIYSFFIFFILWKLKDKKMKKGMMFAIFLMLYSVLRFFTEFFREADVQLGYFFGLTMGQILCLVMFVAGLILVSKFRK
jgi:phosphatidylglycerol:prolipoprotein diacylglycerol transferase